MLVAIEEPPFRKCYVQNYLKQILPEREEKILKLRKCYLGFFSLCLSDSYYAIVVYVNRSLASKGSGPTL